MSPDARTHSHSALTLEECLALETQVWDALVAGDADADRSLLSADFLGVYPSGFANRDEHAEQLDDGPSMTRYVIEQAKLRVISPDHVLLSYLARYHPVSPTDPSRANGEESMYITSLWSRDGDAWINTFSQDTPSNAGAELG